MSPHFILCINHANLRSVALPHAFPLSFGQFPYLVYVAAYSPVESNVIWMESTSIHQTCPEIFWGFISLIPMPPILEPSWSCRLMSLSCWFISLLRFCCTLSRLCACAHISCSMSLSSLNIPITPSRVLPSLLVLLISSIKECVWSAHCLSSSL